MANQKEVFVVHKYETVDNKHSVHFGKDFNKPKNTKRFLKWESALKFAKKKTQEQGGTKFLVDSPRGSRYVKVPKNKAKTKTKPKKKPKKMPKCGK